MYGSTRQLPPPTPPCLGLVWRRCVCPSARPGVAMCAASMCVGGGGGRAATGMDRQERVTPSALGIAKVHTAAAIFLTGRTLGEGGGVTLVFFLP